MKRKARHVLKSLDGLAADLITSGLPGYAKRVRRYRTEITGLLNAPHIPDPCDCGECAECEWRDRVRIVKNRPAKRSGKKSHGLSERDLADAMCSGCGQ